MTLKLVYSFSQFFSPVCLAEDLSWRETIIKKFPENILSHNFQYKKLAHLNTPKEAHLNAIWKFWSNFFRVFTFILTAYYFFFIAYSPFLLYPKERFNQQQSPGHQFWTDGPEVVKIRVLSLQVVYSWPSLYLSLYTLVIGLEATQIYHMITNHNSRSWQE